MSEQPVTKKRRLACDRCNSLKLRCPKTQENQSCTRCLKASVACVFSVSRRGLRPVRAQAQGTLPEYEPNDVHVPDLPASTAITASREPVLDSGFFGNDGFNTTPLNGIDDATMQGQNLDFTIPYLQDGPETIGRSRLFENEDTQLMGLLPGSNEFPTGFASPLNDHGIEDSWDLPIPSLDPRTNNGNSAVAQEAQKPGSLPVPIEIAQQVAELFLDIGKHIATIPPLSIHGCQEAYDAALAANTAPNYSSNNNSQCGPLFAIKTTFQLTQMLIKLYPRVQRTNICVPLTTSRSNFGATGLEVDSGDSGSERSAQPPFSASGETLDHASVLQIFSCHHRLIDTWDLIFSHVRKGIETGKFSRSVGEESPCQRLRIGGFVPSTKVPLEVLLAIEFLGQLLVKARGLVDQITSMQNTEQATLGGFVGDDDLRIASDANVEATKSAGMAVISRAETLVQKTHHIRHLIEETTTD